MPGRDGSFARSTVFACRISRADLLRSKQTGRLQDLVDIERLKGTS
jgi:hypothetical protein